jgi:hypothetical protein
MLGRRIGAQHRVHRLIDEHWWDGYWNGLQGGMGPRRGLSYVDAPAWWDEVSDLAYAAGYLVG